MGKNISRNYSCDVSAIAFDLDGTLIDSLPDLVAAAQTTLKKLGMSSVSPEQVALCVGNGLDVLVEKVISMVTDQRDVSSDIFTKAKLIFKREYQRNGTRQSRVYSGVKETLRLLSDLPIKLACVTNKPKLNAESILEFYELKKYFHLILGGDSLRERKPHPSVMLKVSESFNIDTKKILVIGDSRVDIETARSVDSPVFCVSYGYHGNDSLENLGADAIVDSVRDIFRLIKICK